MTLPTNKSNLYPIMELNLYGTKCSQLNIVENDLLLSNILDFSTQDTISNLMLLNSNTYTKINNSSRTQHYINFFRELFVNIKLTLINKNSPEKNIYLECIEIYQESINALLVTYNKNEMKNILKKNLANLNNVFCKVPFVSIIENNSVLSICHIIKLCTTMYSNRLSKMYRSEIRLILNYYKIGKHIKHGYASYLFLFCMFSILFIVGTLVILGTMTILLRISYYVYIIPLVIFAYIIINFVKIMYFWMCIDYKNIYGIKLYNKVIDGDVFFVLLYIIIIFSSLPHILLIYPSIKCLAYEPTSSHFKIPELYFFEYQSNRYKYLKKV